MVKKLWKGGELDEIQPEKLWMLCFGFVSAPDLSWALTGRKENWALKASLR